MQYSRTPPPTREESPEAGPDDVSQRGEKGKGGISPRKPDDPARGSADSETPWGQVSPALSFVGQVGSIQHKEWQANLDSLVTSMKVPPKPPPVVEHFLAPDWEVCKLINERLGFNGVLGRGVHT